MKTRITFNGSSALQGPCKFCGGVLIITDPKDGEYHTYHSDPMCTQYIELCKAADAEALGASWATSTDQKNWTSVS